MTLGVSGKGNSLLLYTKDFFVYEDGWLVELWLLSFSVLHGKFSLAAINQKSCRRYLYALECFLLSSSSFFIFEGHAAYFSCFLCHQLVKKQTRIAFHFRPLFVKLGVLDTSMSSFK